LSEKFENSFISRKSIGVVKQIRFSNGTYASVDELAASAKLNPKVVRNELRLAFLAPEILDAILNGKPGCSLPDLRTIAEISWRSQRSELYGSGSPA
jgi:hypothetical protein